jgi:hypothetical protein
MDTTATPTPRQRKPRVKPARSIRLIVAPTPTMPGIVQITVGKSTTDYFVEPIASDFGTAFRLTKILGEHDGYHVNLASDPKDHRCDCKGHLKHGHCKHVDSLAALRNAGRI